MGRNYGEILEQWRIITKEIGADGVEIRYKGDESETGFIFEMEIAECNMAK